MKFIDDTAMTKKKSSIIGSEAKMTYRLNRTNV